MDDVEVLHQIIKIYEKKRILWDSKDSEYYNKNKREDEWREMSATFKIPVKELKKKVQSLLGSYRREKSRENKSRLTGSGAEDIYTSKWFAYSWFQFLKDKNLPSNTTDSMTIARNPTIDSMPDNIQGDIEQTDPHNTSTTTTDLVTESNTQNTITSTPVSTAASQSITNRIIPLRKRRAIEEKKQQAMIESAFNLLKNTAETPEDALVMFGNHVVSELRKYDARKLPYVKKAILDVLFQADIGQIPRQRSDQCLLDWSSSSTYVPTTSPQSVLSAESPVAPPSPTLTSDPQPTNSCENMDLVYFDI